jgi:hypothetical protein
MWQEILCNRKSPSRGPPPALKGSCTIRNSRLFSPSCVQPSAVSVRSNQMMNASNDAYSRGVAGSYGAARLRIEVGGPRAALGFLCLPLEMSFLHGIPRYNDGKW